MTEHPAYDVAVVGGGPAGAACGTVCAEGGLRTVVLEKSIFPRDKVCGDCVNPGCWSVFEQLGVTSAVLSSPHLPISRVAFVGADGQRIDLPLEGGEPGEISITRRILDDILLRRCEEAGAEVWQDTTLRSLSRDPTGLWQIETGSRTFIARRLVAADGRNSTVARLLGVSPAARRDRVGLQGHVPTPASQVRGIELHLLREGYCGIVPIKGELTNFCLVAAPARMDALKAAVSARFAIPDGQQWRAIAPLERAPLPPLCDEVVYVGDAARVVEPFTGEGIYYALRSGTLAAGHILAGSVERYPASLAALYRKRLWINRLSRWAVTQPQAGAMLLRALAAHPASLQYLVRRVTGSRPISA